MATVLRRLGIASLVLLLAGSAGAESLNTRPTSGELRAMRNWAEEVFSGKAKMVPTPESMPASRLAPAIPFSFVYGGTSSAKLLPMWKQTQSKSAIDASRTRYILSYDDPGTGLAVECEAIVYSRYPTVDYVLRFHNRGHSETPVLQDILPLDLQIGAQKDEAVRVHSSQGGGNSPEDYRLYHDSLEPGKTFTLAAGGGRSSNTRMPWFNVQWPGGGILVAVGWSGQWKAGISREENLVLRAGMEDSHFFLKPGEAVRTPRIILTRWEGDELFRSYNISRHLMMDYYLPRVNGELVFPPVSKPTAYDELDVATWRSTHGEQNQLDIIREAHDLGIEYYWLDAYWFEGYFPKGVGNWQFPILKGVRESFPRGLKPLADAAHQRGMGFILWFEPERVYRGTYVDREKQSWTIRLPDSHNSLFNLGITDARDWMTRYVIEALETFGVDVCRIDFNTNPLPYWRQADSPDRRGISEIRYISNLYSMWDEIIRSKPGLWMDNCASGGRRIDVETCSRALPLWRSDFNDTPKRKQDEIGSIADQVMTMGLSLYMPLHSGPVWRPDPYHWRSAMSAGNAIYWDIRPNRQTGRYEYDRELTRKAIHECKSLRPYYLGDYYPLTEMSADSTVWAAYEYVRPEEGDGFAVFFRRPDSPYPKMEARFHGIEPARHYKVTWHSTYDVARAKVLKGADLLRFTAEINDKPGSLLVRFRRVK